MWGGMTYPAGNFRRIANRPSFEGSPYKTATCAPFGMDGGAGPHFISPVASILCSSSARAGQAYANAPRVSAPLSTVDRAVFILNSSPFTNFLWLAYAPVLLDRKLND